MKVFAWICAGLMALAVIPAYADSGCSEKHENVSRFNPTELSDYQKCVYEWAGKTSGSHAGFVWFSIDGKFHHISNDEITATSRDDLEHLIVKTILASEAAEQLATKQRELEAVQAASRLIGEENEALQAANGRLTTEIGQLRQIMQMDIHRIYEHANWIAAYLHAEPTSKARAAARDRLDHNFQINIAENDSENYFTLNQDDRGRINAAIVAADLVNEMHRLADDIYNKGYQDGYEVGYLEGYVHGYQAGVAAQ